jgi:hypothetical protein
LWHAICVIPVKGAGSFYTCVPEDSLQTNNYTMIWRKNHMSAQDFSSKRALGFIIAILFVAAGATQFGGITMGGFQLEVKTYDAKFAHFEELDTCDSCHDPHSLEINVDTCAACHDNVVTHENLKDIRFYSSASDYDGDGSSTEPLVEEIETLQEKLYASIQSYATNVAMEPIMYDSHSYPYWFNGNGIGAIRSNGYSSFTPRLLMAAYNYQFIKKDPGGYVHNGHYILQLLYDGLADLGTKVAVDVTDMVRPLVTNTSAECGDATYPYPPGDLNQDCRVTFADIALLGANWLEDDNPQLPKPFLYRH